MRITTYALGQLQANCYILEQDKDCILIDPGDSADFILEYLQRNNLNLNAIIATHGHFDHVMAVGEIQMTIRSVYGNVPPLYIDKADHPLIKRLGETAKHFLKYEPQVVKPLLMQPLPAGTITVGTFTFEVIKTPGHTPGGSCFYFPESKAVFTGDTLFAGAVGRYDFSYSDKDQLKKSVHGLLQMDEEITIYPGHGESSFIQIERMNEPYFFSSSWG